MIASINNKKIFHETLYHGYHQSIGVSEILFEHKTDHQHLVIFNNPIFGNVMALDGIVQTTEKDEFIYHEMLVHLPVIAHGNVKDILIIGGGDGGILREALSHKAVESVTLVEIDQAVIDMCQEYFPGHSKGAFDHPKAKIVIQDGCKFVKNPPRKYDLIICDSTDPIGPGEVLFTSKFYKDCKNALNPDGIMVTQNGVMYFQIDELKKTLERFEPLYKDVSFYTAAVPTYVGGSMAFGWGTDELSYRNHDIQVITQRFIKSGIKTKYYNPAIHIAAFALPQYVIDTLKK
ncbi:polyamine aminopropyltransferase [Francisella hispaniensis]|uniref:Polyamine aminopropyltransferase n=1 Tax=Francisella hispaniensis TaxID=622488 RepID=F4BJK3_9GAMM|nr:polyamine aminopropyltransferase [Francisella hispaniensis]AEB28347.1 Spermidine synthase [Francisella hispaniensis]